LVEHDLAKVGVAGSSPVFRSAIHQLSLVDFFSKFHKFFSAPVVELVDTQDLKSCGQQCLYGFNSRLGHYLLLYSSKIICPGGEIGRRTTLRWWRPKGCAGSNPVSGTKLHSTMELFY
jgi:hypothetical protein